MVYGVSALSGRIRNSLPNKNRIESSNLFGFRAGATLLSHVPKKNLAVLLLSTLHHNAAVDSNGKAEINLFYNQTKGGVDTLDQLCHAYTVQRKTNRWPNAFFMNLVNVCGIAAYVIFRHSFEVKNGPRQGARKKFLNTLADQLTYNHIKKRSIRGLSSLDQSVIDQVVGLDETRNDAILAPPPAKKMRRRCHLCPSNKDRKVIQCCGKCNKNVCNEHADKVLTCRKCIANLNSSDSQ